LIGLTYVAPPRWARAWTRCSTLPHASAAT
jgi:hypothetical protein